MNRLEGAPLEAEPTMESLPKDDERLSFDEAVLYQHVATTREGLDFSEKPPEGAEKYAEDILACFKENGFDVTDDMVRKIVESTDLSAIIAMLKEYIAEKGGDASMLEETVVFASPRTEADTEHFGENAVSKTTSGTRWLTHAKSLIGGVAIAIAATNPGSAFARNFGYSDTGEGIPRVRTEQNVEGRAYKRGESPETDRYSPVDLMVNVEKFQEKYKDQFAEIMRKNPRIKSITIDPYSTKGTFGFMEKTEGGKDAGMIRAVVMKMVLGVEGKNGKGALYTDSSYQPLSLGGGVDKTLGATDRLFMRVLRDNSVYGHNSQGPVALKKMGESVGVQNLADESVERILKRISKDWSSEKSRNDHGKVEYFKDTE